MNNNVTNVYTCDQTLPSRESIQQFVNDVYELSKEPKQTEQIPISFGGDKITITMTTCKRYELFERTVKSVVRCIQDINKYVKEWIVVDDNSSPQDRERMQTNFPFITYVFKTYAQKGHARSMNLILKRVTTPYILHVEDDMQFDYKYNFLQSMTDIIQSEQNCVQVLFNANYTETYDFYVDPAGGELCKTPSGHVYLIHKHTLERFPFANCRYWPGFSLRPSLWDVNTLREKVGYFSTTAPHFEMEYSRRVLEMGYKVCFLPGTAHQHIGRLTNTEGDNAYSLNGEEQFRTKSRHMFDEYTWVVVNLDKRPDRLARFYDSTKHIATVIERSKAIDGSSTVFEASLKPLFAAGDYNFHAGIVGCAMSHISLWQSLLWSLKRGLVIFEDDYDPEGEDIEDVIAEQLRQAADWDIVFISHHKRPGVCVKEGVVDANTAFAYSLGGTFAYVITQEGARKMLDFIHAVGMTNAIDTMMQKSADHGVRVKYLDRVYGTSPLANFNENIDSDIQHCETQAQFS